MDTPVAHECREEWEISFREYGLAYVLVGGEGSYFWLRCLANSPCREQKKGENEEE